MKSHDTIIKWDEFRLRHLIKYLTSTWQKTDILPWIDTPTFFFSDIMILTLTAFNFFILYGFFKFMTVSSLLCCAVVKQCAVKEICTLVELYSHSNIEEHVLHYWELLKGGWCWDSRSFTRIHGWKDLPTFQELVLLL